MLPEDLVLPSVAVSSPAPNGSLDSWTGAVSGTAQDPENSPGVPGSGISRVALQLLRSWTGSAEYLNNGVWNSTATYYNATLGTPDLSGLLNWDLNLSGVTSLPAGRYQLRVQALDRYNNAVTSNFNYTAGALDSTAPTASVTVPGAGANLSRLTALSGSSADEVGGSGLARVYVQLSGLFPSGGSSVRKYWTGSAWSTATVNIATLVPSVASGTYTWNIGSGLPSGGNLTTGAYQVKTWCFDRYGNTSATVTRDFNIVANTAPVASAQTVAVRFNIPASITLQATDAEGDAVTYAVATQPAHGSLTGSGANLTYTPATDYSGPDSFTFTGSDYALTGAAAAVTINVGSEANTAPVADGQTLTTAYNTALPVTLSAIDAQGDEVTYTVTSQPSHGTLSGMLPNVTYTPTSGYSGADSFKFKGSDFQLSGEEATISITVSPRPNTAPVASAQSLTTRFKTALPITLSATDAESDAITYEVTAQPTHGTLTGTAPNLTYTPTGEYVGSDTFSFRGKDFGLTGEAVAVSIVVEKPILDLLIKNDAGDWLGADHLAADATGQTVSSVGRAGRTITRTMRIDCNAEPPSEEDWWEGMTYQLKAVPVPIGWTARYYFGGWEVTSSILDEYGFTDWISYGGSNYLTVELTPSAGIADLDATVQVTLTPYGEPGGVDSAKVLHTSKMTSQPDVWVRRMAELDGDFFNDPIVGQGLSDYGAPSTLELPTTMGLAQRFEVSLKNLGADPRTMTLRMKAPPADWNATLYYGVDEEFGGGTALVPVTEGEWRVYTVPDQVTPYAVAKMRLETSLKPEASLTAVYECKMLSLGEAAIAGLPQEKDEVSINHYSATIEKVVYSFDGQNWSEVGTEPIVLNRRQSVILKAVKAGGSLWPERPIKLPVWKWNGQPYYGEKVAFNFDRATPVGVTETLTVECGNTKTVQVKVNPIVEETLPD